MLKNNLNAWYTFTSTFCCLFISNNKQDGTSKPKAYLLYLYQVEDLIFALGWAVMGYHDPPVLNILYSFNKHKMIRKHFPFH